MTEIDRILQQHKEQQKLIVDETKTVKEWFEQKLPEPYKELALRCYEKKLQIKTDRFRVAFATLYPWDNTPLGKEFWGEMWNYADGDRTTLPPIPGIHTEPQQVIQPIVKKVVKQIQPEITQGLEPVKMVTEVYLTKHVIPYNNGRLPLFASL